MPCCVLGTCSGVMKISETVPVFREFITGFKSRVSKTITDKLVFIGYISYQALP